MGCGSGYASAVSTLVKRVAENMDGGRRLGVGYDGVALSLEEGRWQCLFSDDASSAVRWIALFATAMSPRMRTCFRSAGNTGRRFASIEQRDSLPCCPGDKGKCSAAFIYSIFLLLQTVTSLSCLIISRSCDPARVRDTVCRHEVFPTLRYEANGGSKALPIVGPRKEPKPSTLIS